MTCTWSAAILAGGRARRLGGGAKPLLEVGGVPIVERQLAMFATIGVVPRIVAVEAGRCRTWASIVPDPGDGGALGGLYTALETAVTEAVVVVAGDMPFLTARFVDALLAHLASHDGALPRTGAAGWHPLAAVYRRRVAPRLRDRLDRGERRVVDAVTTLDVAVLDDTVLARLDPDGTLLCNANTPADVDRARRHAEAGRAAE